MIFFVTWNLYLIILVGCKIISMAIHFVRHTHTHMEGLTVVCENEVEQNEMKWNETKWKSVVCEMKNCSLKTVVCEMKICSLGNESLQFGKWQSVV